MLRQGPNSLQRLRKLSDEICMKHGFSVLPPSPKRGDGMSAREYRRLCERPTAYATQAQMDELLKAVKHLEQMTEQAGEKKEKRFSLPKFRLPGLHLSIPEWDWPTVVTITMALAMAALLLLWFKLGGDWNSLSLLHR